MKLKPAIMSNRNLKNTDIYFPCFTVVIPKANGNFSTGITRELSGSIDREAIDLSA
jgi:hypothetical protein